MKRFRKIERKPTNFKATLPFEVDASDVDADAEIAVRALRHPPDHVMTL